MLDCKKQQKKAFLEYSFLNVGGGTSHQGHWGRRMSGNKGERMALALLVPVRGAGLISTQTHALHGSRQSLLCPVSSRNSILRPKVQTYGETHFVGFNVRSTKQRGPEVELAAPEDGEVEEENPALLLDYRLHEGLQALDRGLD